MSEHQFLELFSSHESACTFGRPDKNAKKGMSYTTEKRGFTVDDVRRHLSGTVSIVAIPLRRGHVAWGCIDDDRYTPEARAEVSARITELPEPLYAFESKSGGLHIFIFFAQPLPAFQARVILKEIAAKLGIPTAEIFPKQNDAEIGNGVNLPFFGSLEFDFHPEKLNVEPEKFPAAEPKPEIFDEDAGYWSDVALQAMLTFYKENFPGFDFHKCRGGYAVPCPGNPALGGWEDGAIHSTDDALLSHEAIVFIKNCWPKFRCVHAHCDGGTGEKKKTINDWRAYWDPLRLWEFEEWQDAEIARLEKVHG